MRESGCIDNNNTCTKEGFCECIDPDQDPVGSGGTAQCIPKENMNYFSSGAEKVISFYAALFFVFAFVCLVWTYWYRSNMLVKVSQPACLYLLLLGTIISTSSLLPMSYQTGYRDSSDIRVADASCMMVPWLWGLGFTITFSSLFAKVSRVKKLFNAARAMQRKKIGVEQIIKCMIPMLTINLCILISFQIVSPRQWQRDVLQEIDGFTIESEGYCSSDYGWYFFLALVIFDLASLFVALILCFQTKHIPSDFADSSHIFLAVMFMFQVLTLAVPVCAMVKDDPDAFLFTLATAIFLSNFTVLVIIFGPKMYRIYKGEDTAQSVKKAMSFVADPYGAGAGAKPSWHSLSNGPEAGGAGAKPSWFDESARSSNTPDAGGAKSVKKSISFAENLPRNVDSTTSSNAFDSSRKEKAGKFAVTESDTAGTFQHPQVSSQKEEMMGGALSVES